MTMYVRRGGDGGRPPPQGRTRWDVMHPEGSEGTWRDRPAVDRGGDGLLHAALCY